MPRAIRINTHTGPADSWEMAACDAPDSLAPLVRGYTDYRERTSSFATRRELPSLNPVLIFNLGPPTHVTGGDGRDVALGQGEGFVAGIHDRHALSSSNGEQAGVHVWLTMKGYQHVLGAAAGATANRVVKLGDILGLSCAALGGRLVDAGHREARFALLDDAMAAWLANGAAPRREAEWAFGQIRRQPSRPIAAIAEEIGWSRKTLASVFRDRYGVAPKTAARIARFERAIACSSADAPPDWAIIAQEAGYFDQSHMIRDFIAFTGLTPAAYRRHLLPDGGGVVAG